MEETARIETLSKRLDDLRRQMWADPSQEDALTAEYEAIHRERHALIVDLRNETV